MDYHGLRLPAGELLLEPVSRSKGHLHRHPPILPPTWHSQHAQRHYNPRRSHPEDFAATFEEEGQGIHRRHYAARKLVSPLRPFPHG